MWCKPGDIVRSKSSGYVWLVGEEGELYTLGMKNKANHLFLPPMLVSVEDIKEPFWNHSSENYEVLTSIFGT